jgi:hypothetical protein
MIRNNNIDYNQVIGLEEANRILEILKRHYPGIFDGLTIKYGGYYCYDDFRHVIYIQWKMEETDEDVKRENAVIDIINKKYGLNLGYSKREKSVQAFLHELGHAADLSYKKAFGQYEEYMQNEEDEKVTFYLKQQDYNNIRHELNDVYDEIIELNPIGNEIKLVELNSKMEELEIELEEAAKELDREYREIITEKAADKFSADLIKGLCRGLI